ncbi:ABC transporter ATP-binding protein, partial [Rhizobium ruizarguesonis]
MLGRRLITAVKDVSFEMGEKPEILSIVGESGSGKST